MRIRVDEIPESGRTLRFHWDQEKLAEFLPPDDPFGLKLLRPVNVTLTINRLREHIQITGRIEGSIEVVCHRCLKDFGYPLKEDVEIYLVEEDQAPEEEETELDLEELEYEFFDGEIIDIDQLVAEQIFLALPVKVLCTDDCKGICPSCGANLNDEPCRCEVKSSGSPFEKLASIKPKLPESRDSDS